MRKYRTEQQTKEVQVLDSITCDKCHKPIKVYDEWTIQGAQVSLNAGYGSRFDCEWLEGDEFDLCDECLEELARSLGWRPDQPELDKPQAP